MDIHVLKIKMDIQILQKFTLIFMKNGYWTGFRKWTLDTGHSSRAPQVHVQCTRHTFHLPWLESYI